MGPFRTSDIGILNDALIGLLNDVQQPGAGPRWPRWKCSAFPAVAGLAWKAIRYRLLHTAARITPRRPARPPTPAGRLTLDPGLQRAFTALPRIPSRPPPDRRPR